MRVQFHLPEVAEFVRNTLRTTVHQLGVYVEAHAPRNVAGLQDVPEGGTLGYLTSTVHPEDEEATELGLIVEWISEVDHTKVVIEPIVACLGKTPIHLLGFKAISI